MHWIRNLVHAVPFAAPRPILVLKSISLSLSAVFWRSTKPVSHLRLSEKSSQGDLLPATLGELSSMQLGSTRVVTQMQTACSSSFYSSHTPENNSDPVLPSQISARECSRSSPMPPVRSSGRKRHRKVTRNEMKQNTESGSKREKRDNDARRKDSAQLSAASRAGEFLAPETQVSTRSRPAVQVSPAMVISKLREPLYSRKQCPAVLNAPRKHGCGRSTAMPLHLFSSGSRAHDAKHTGVLPSVGATTGISSVEAAQSSNTRIMCNELSLTKSYIVLGYCPVCLLRAAPNKHCSYSAYDLVQLASNSMLIEYSALSTSPLAAILSSAHSVRTRPSIRAHSKPFGDSDSLADVVPATVPMLLVDSRLGFSHSRNTCEVLPPPPMLSRWSESSVHSIPAAAASHPSYSRIHPEHFGGSELIKDIVSNTVPVLSAGRRLCSLHPGSTCEGVPSPMLSDSNIARPALPNYVHNVATLLLHRCSEISRIPDANALELARLFADSGISGAEMPSATLFLNATLFDDSVLFYHFSMELVGFASGVGSMIDKYVPLRIDSVTLSSIRSPLKRSALETSPMSVSADIRTAWAAHLYHLPVDLFNEHQTLMDFISVISANSGVHSAKKIIVGEICSYDPSLGRGTDTTTSLRDDLSSFIDSSLARPGLMNRTIRTSSSVYNLPLHLRRQSNSSSGSIVTSEATHFTWFQSPTGECLALSAKSQYSSSLCSLMGPPSAAGSDSNVHFIVQTQYNSGSPEYISPVLDEVLFPNTGIKSSSQVAEDSFNITGAIGAAHTHSDAMIWVYPAIIRINSENPAVETWHRQNCNTLSCVTRQ
ncbi:hypothetical protein B0H13DRAFT_1935920 [Mycena leptocephala]|nr:hypothetical protein B0H13DRAFT_1935920 [Mycena leptocephala]